MTAESPSSSSLNGPDSRLAGVWLQAGPLSVLFHEGDLRRIKWGNLEIIRRIYGAVRDRNWGTVPGTLTHLEIVSTDSTFQIRYLREHRQNELQFVWQAEILGAADGTIQFTFDGEAKSNFWRNRIGLCVLHPIRECSGARCRTLHADGTTKELAFPEWVAAEQPIDGFTNLVGIAHEVAAGLWLECTFDGELFETEDQRNWIDASFKTYSTPLGLPFPVEIPAGSRIRQSVSLKLVGSLAARDTQETARPDPPRGFASTIFPTRIGVVGAALALPALGLGVSSRKASENDPNQPRFAALALAHLRHDVRLGRSDWGYELIGAWLEASVLGLPLELAVHLEAAYSAGLLEAFRFLKEPQAGIANACRLTRILVFQDGQKSTPSAALETVREAFEGLGIPVGSGTDADLYQLHLQPPTLDGDFLCWSMNPQVHATDDLSLTETPEAVRHQLATLRHRYPSLPLVISPITLKPRFNPVATAPEAPPAINELPSPVDPRQMSLVGAAWTLAMLKALAEGGATSVTFFETTGWLGVMETASGSPLPDHFPSRPGCVFPVYHVLTDLAPFARGFVVPTETGDPLNVVTLLLQAGKRRRLLVANLTTERQRVSLENFDGLEYLRLLDEAAIPEAMNDPEAFRERRTPFTGKELALTAHALATLDFAEN